MASSSSSPRELPKSEQPELEDRVQEMHGFPSARPRPRCLEDEPVDEKISEVVAEDAILPSSSSSPSLTRMAQSCWSPSLLPGSSSSPAVTPRTPLGLWNACDGIQQSLSSAKNRTRDGLVHAKDGLTHAKDAAKDGLNHAKDAAVNMKAEVTEEFKKNLTKLAKRTEHAEDMANTVPEVGMLLDAGQFGGSSPSTAPVDMPAGLKVAMDVEVSYYGEPHRLLVLRRDWPPGCNGLQSPAKEILDIIQLVRENEAFASYPAWPLHDPKVSEAVMAMETEELAYATGMEDMPRWRRTILKILRALRITAPSVERVDAFKEHYGPSVEFMFAWSAFLIQQLWILVIYAIISVLVGFTDLRSTADRRWIYEVMKVGVVFWSAWVALLSTRKFPVSKRPFGVEARNSNLQLGDWRQENRGEKLKRWLMLLLVAVPLVTITLTMVLLTFIAVTMLVLRVIFIWGDCLTLHSDASVCRDATVKYSFLGWAAEVGCDILLAVLFEIFFQVGNVISAWVAGLLNYRYKSDMQLFKSMLELCLAALERIGFVGCLAFFFVPQWAPPVCPDRLSLADCDCDDLVLGNNDFRCYQRRLPVEMRRWLFESLLKGPFIVAPFVNIILKVLVPKFVECLASCGGGSSNWRCCFWLGPLRGLVRFFTLIFTYDGESVKCFTYVYRGSPFAPLPRDMPEREKAMKALKQFKVKTFEVEEELMELEMCLLWVTFFMPILPHGVIITMFAKLIEVNTDLTKLLFVRRRPVPADDSPVRREINTYAWCVVVASLGWTVGLSLITYNDDLYKWESGGVGIFFGMVAFMLVGSAFTTWLVSRLSVRRLSLTRLFSFKVSFKVWPEESVSARASSAPGTPKGGA